MIGNIAFFSYLAFCSVFLFLFGRKEQKNQFLEWRIMREKAERVENAKKYPKFAFLSDTR